MRIQKNFLLIFISFLFAVLLWLYINLSLIYTVNKVAKLDFKLNKNQAIATELPDSVELMLRGKGWDLFLLYLKGKSDFSIDLTGYRKDVKLNLLQHLQDSGELPSSVSILNVNPQFIDLVFDNVTSRKVPVKNNVRIVPKDGYIVVSSPQIQPDSVKITGALSIINKIRVVGTESLKIENVSSDFSKEVKIIDTSNKNIKIEPDRVTISYKIELAAEKSFDNVTVNVQNIPPDKEVLLIPPKIKIFVRGGVETLAKVLVESISANIDYEVIEEDKLGYVIPEIRLPSDITLVKLEPEKLQYIIKRKTSQ
ncbi:MAG: CdaR family protein [Ignavibacteria bacterium]